MMRIATFSRCLARGVMLQRQLARPVSTASVGSGSAEVGAPPAASTGPTSEEKQPQLPLRKWSVWRKISRVFSYQEGLFIVPISLKDEAGSATKRQLLPWIWLRDQCRCASCVNQDTQQRQVKTFEIPRGLWGRVKLRQDASKETEQVDIMWSDGHFSTYDGSFLHYYTVADERPNPSVPGRYNESWGAKGPKQPPIVQYKKVMETEEGVRILTDLIKRRGFAFVDGTPYGDPEHTKRLLERIAFIRITHYGGFYDFTADLAMADTAYTNISLPAHTDTTYFDDPAGLQAFHMLSHEPDASSKDANSLGGESLLVDGFNAALTLKKVAPRAYQILSEVPLPWHASGNKGIAITPERTYPVFELSDNGKRLVRVRWNNDDRGVVPFHPKYSPNEWYEAASRWNALLEDEKLQYWEQLKPGRTLIFDNWRVLHGRNAFTGKRRICGAYINRNDFMSRWRTLNRTPEEVNRVVIG